MIGDSTIRAARWGVLVWFAVCAEAWPGLAQESTLVELLAANSHPLAVENGKLIGPGAEVLLDAAVDAQFFLIAEEHNVGELNLIAEALFRALSDDRGFQYVALEQGSVIASWFGDRQRRGDLKAIHDLVRRYPHAPTFATDSELAFIASVGRLSTARNNPIWGIDQELGALHLLERLAELAPSEAAKARAVELASEARPHERNRRGDVHYLVDVATPDDFLGLVELFVDGSTEARALIAALARTSRIYNDWARGARRGESTGYRSGSDRELSMKQRFMERYEAARAAGDPRPRVLVKAGHWHVFRGIYRAAVPTFGNFLSEFAISHGMESFVLSTYVTHSPEKWRNTRGPLAMVVPEGVTAVVDFRPLRGLAYQNAIANLDDEFKATLFRADAALVISGGRTGPSTVTDGAR